MAIEKKANYFGTAVEGERDLWIFPKRYRENNMSMKGNGVFKVESSGVRFAYLVGGKSFLIPVKSINKVDIGKGAAGQYNPKADVIRIYWSNDGKKLISGFKLWSNLELVKSELEKLIK
ncbi:MAG: hypothetical protein ABIJ08_00470 [Nanoarchaeota archaeon]